MDVTIEGDSIEVDFFRSSDQMPAALNSYINYTRAYTVFAVKVFSDALLPQNEGGIRSIRTVAREGSFFNPRFPASSGGRATVQIRIFDAINGALSQALPARAMGASSHWSNPNIGGIDLETGRQFVMYDLGFARGARGFSRRRSHRSSRNIPVEVRDQQPGAIRRLELIEDSGGAGRHRGCGLRKDYSAPRVRSATGTGTRTRPTACSAGNRVRGCSFATERPRCAPSEGDLLSFRLAGAGGYGDPRERDREAVRRDVADGLVSPEAARTIYGFDPGAGD